MTKFADTHGIAFGMVAVLALGSAIGQVWPAVGCFALWGGAYVSGGVLEHRRLHNEGDSHPFVFGILGGTFLVSVLDVQIPQRSVFVIVGAIVWYCIAMLAEQARVWGKAPSRG